MRSRFTATWGNTVEHSVWLDQLAKPVLFQLSYVPADYSVYEANCLKTDRHWCSS